MSGVLPNFLIIGVQKSGTTSLMHYLNAHPDVFVPLNEIHYFDWNFDRGVDWYKAHFADVTTEHAVGEKTPEYIYYDQVPARMVEILPEPRLIVILRNPVDRAYSHYWFNRTRGSEPLEFTEALAAEPERLAAGDILARARYSYLDRGHYLAQIQRVCEYYPRSALKVILLEDLRDARLETFHSISRFLEVDDTFIPANLEVMKNRFVKFRSMRLRSPIRRFPHLFRRIAGRLNIRYSSYPPLDPSVREKLSKYFEEDNVALETWLGRDLSAWRSSLS